MADFEKQSGHPVEFRELQLYIDNDRDLYRQREAIEKNLLRKAAKGRYDKQKAPKLWQYMVDEGARKYCKEFGCQVRTTFPKKMRVELSKQYACDWEEGDQHFRLDNPHHMTKAQAWADFKTIYLPGIPANDKPGRREAWNNYTDGLMKDGLITAKQYETWDHPKGLYMKAKKNPLMTKAQGMALAKKGFKKGKAAGATKKKRVSNVRSLVAKALK